MKPWMKITSGILLSALVIAFIILWDTVIKERIDSVDVVIVRPGVVIEQNEVITDDKLMVEKRNKATLVEGTVYAPTINDVIGYEAKQKLYGNTILSERDVEFTRFAPKAEKGESIRPIPNEWIYAAPSTIRRKDYIDFYLFKPIKDGEFREASLSYNGLSPEQQAQIKKINDQIEKENEKYKEERENIAKDKNVEVEKDEKTLQEVQEEVKETLEKAEEIMAVDPEVEEIGEKIKNTHQDAVREKVMKKLGISDEEWITLTESGEIPLLVDVPIIYVKDGTGNEIQNGENSTEEERLNSTGQITNLEVILNEDQYRSIKKYMEMGYKLYITYN